MNRRQWIQSAAGLAAPSLAQSRRPNFIFLFSDDHHYQCLGANGNPKLRTPHLDALARRGVNFVNGQITTSQCAPSRGICLSGLETFQSGLLSNGQTGFRPGYGPTVVEQLRRAGYDTTLIGKWHIQPEPEQCGFARAPLWLRGGASQYLNPALRRGFAGDNSPVDGHITHLFTDAAIQSIQSAARPYLLWLAYNAPHSPLYASRKFREMYEGKNDLAPPAHPKNAREFDWVSYYSAISELDDSIGRLIAAVEKSGQWSNTVIFFLGDNGFMCGAKNWNGKVVPWEDSVRIPFFAAGGPVKSTVRVQDPVASIDVPATWLDLAGVKPAYSLAGDSLRSYLEKGTGARRAAFSTWNDGRVGALATKQQVEPYRLVRTRTHKLILWESRNQALFDLSTDPHEENNLAAVSAHNKTLDQLKEILRARMQRTEDPALAWL
jgi:arylsulfatase A-like enzyme